jgi:aspartyl-tRNA synthetase
MAKYGSDKPDLRNPLIINDVSDVFKDSSFAIFSDLINKNGFVVLAVKAPNTATQPRSFFDKLNNWAQEEGAKGLGYIVYESNETKGPIAKNLDAERITKIKTITNAQDGDSVFFVCADPKYFVAQKFAGKVRSKLGNELNLIDKTQFKFCWIVDLPFYEYNEDEKKIDFCHNPFSMPQGGIDSLINKSPLDIVAYQYDMVCNGFEICSGGVRNHDTETAYKAFEIAGYARNVVDEKFSAIMTAFKFGVPPHAGCAYGLERQFMLLLDEPNLREVIMFPPNQKGEDLMMNAPSELDEKQLKELHLQVKKIM